MKKALAFAALGLSLMSSNALAGEHRGGDAAIGALSGAVVFGPVGALAGALVGFTAGPGIAHSWGIRESSTPRHARRPARQETAASAGQPSHRDQASASPAAQPQPPSAATRSTTPPVQTLE
jgi:predicted lipid-binding transport protein (Tim44 family)